MNATAHSIKFDDTKLTTRQLARIISRARTFGATVSGSFGKHKITAEFPSVISAVIADLAALGVSVSRTV